MAYEEVDLTAENNIHNKGLIVGSQGLNLQAKNNIINESTAQLLTDIKLKMAAKKINNQGQIASYDQLSIDASSINNQGELLSNNELKISSDHVNNTHKIIAKSDLILNANTIDNDGLIKAGKNISIKADQIRNGDFSYQSYQTNADTTHQFKENIQNTQTIDSENVFYRKWRIKVWLGRRKIIKNYKKDISDPNYKQEILTGYEELKMHQKGEIISGGNIHFDVNKIDNRASIIYAKNKSIVMHVKTL